MLGKFQTGAEINLEKMIVSMIGTKGAVRSRSLPKYFN